MRAFNMFTTKILIAIPYQFSLKTHSHASNMHFTSKTLIAMLTAAWADWDGYESFYQVETFL